MGRITGTLALLCLAFLPFHQTMAGDGDKPNILMIICDDLNHWV
jgi:hypothetical protein